MGQYFDAWVSGDLQIFVQFLTNSFGHQSDQSKAGAIYSNMPTSISLSMQDLSFEAASFLDGQEHILLDIKHTFYIPNP
jgi:hypothetical protein